jgi:predicted helicase
MINTNEGALEELLNQLRNTSKTQREKGTSFENLVKIFFENDSTYSIQFDKIYTYQEWAKEQQRPATDIGIDLVAKNINDDFYTAIQCKFYDENSTIDKKGLDSFIASSDSDIFNHRIFIDTTKKGLSDKLETQINNSSKTFTRIGISELQNSSISWSKYLENQLVEQEEKKILRPHQQEALNNVKNGLKNADRGKLIMACGSGKTFTSLKIAEDLVGKNKSILFLVPSLALMSQTITEWAKESSINLNIYAVCSDTQVGKRKNNNDDLAEISIHDLAYPATTNAKKLADKYTIEKDKMTVIFATYQSIEVISKAQKSHKLSEFDMVICDEAHRTSGATLKNDETSNFNKIHSNDNIAVKKRLYMTATPRIYIPKVKKVAREKDAMLYSMDDEKIYGKELHVLNFGDAIDKKLLTDYKVIVLALNEDEIGKDIQNQLSDKEGGLKLDDAIKMIGCYKALSKVGIANSEGENAMQRAVSFCRDIKSSTLFTNQFSAVVNTYIDNDKNKKDKNNKSLECKLQHVDGKMNTAVRNTKLDWLKGDIAENNCHILSNARCLSEGVDVPSLDAVMFIHPRKSKTDIVQSVGRVMRVAKGKKLGYIILPVVIPAGVEPSDALNNNPKYEIIWDVLNALRSHDERLDSDINQMAYGGLPKQMEIISEITSISRASKSEVGVGGKSTENKPNNNVPNQLEISYEFDSVQKAIMSKIVDKCGTKTYWADWAKDIAEIAQKNIDKINNIISNKKSSEYKAVDDFLKELQKNINTSISHKQVVEMLAQHIIAKPVFNALFKTHNFTENNPVSRAMQKVIEVLEKHNIDEETKSLDGFYKSIETRANSITNNIGRQKIIIELYDKFFKNAFPKMTEKLGIVYTPVECVDFIINSVNDILQKEFNQSLGDKNIDIVDPFTGTGTFITRLIQSGLLDKEQLKHKYKNGLYANEIVLLAYYIATINIESAYYDIVNDEDYKEFEGISLTDTFQLYENEDDLITPLLPINSERLNKQKNLDIKVIIGNPPYSIGQKSANDNNQNVLYPKLDASIESSYVKNSTAGLSKGVYDSYIRAIRWASDRIGDTGVIGFITNAGWIESNSADGLRQSLQKEFSNIYIFHLRGNARTNGDLRRKEKDNVFGQGTRTPIAISILVKNPKAKTTGNIYFHDIGDYLKREEKLKIIADFGSIKSISDKDLWQKIQPDKYSDWLNQRDDSFYNHIAMGDKKDILIGVFKKHATSLMSARDAWVYNNSKTKLAKNVNKMIDFYNQELQHYTKALEKNKKLTIDNFINTDKTKIAWTVNLKNDLKNHKKSQFYNTNIVKSLYRPFTKQHCYFNRQWNERVSQMPQIFPETGLDNLVIGMTGNGAKEFCVLISSVLIDYQTLFNGKCFPLKLYEPILDKKGKGQDGLYADNLDKVVEGNSGQKYKVRDGITDEGLKNFTDYYKDTNIGKEALFYYIYGLLHSPDYKKRFANNLIKDLPRIPKVKSFDDFEKFSKAGRDLADLHLNYESKKEYEVDFKNDITALKDESFYVEKIKFDDKNDKNDKSVIIYNPKITITNIPLKAYDYVVNGKSAIEWVMERQSISTHKDSQITNNPNDWASEEMNNPKYPLELLLKVITISVGTVKIVGELPKLDF